MKSAKQVCEPLLAEFWWTNAKGHERWATIKYERLSDFCYGCGSLEHTSRACNLDIVLSEVNNKLPMYGLWLTCARQRKQSGWHQIGGGEQKSASYEGPRRKIWRDLMREGGAASTYQTGANKTPKTENEELARQDVGYQSHDQGENMLGSTLNRGAEEKDQDTPLV